MYSESLWEMFSFTIFYLVTVLWLFSFCSCENLAKHLSADKITLITPTFQRDQILANFLDHFAVKLAASCPIIEEIFISWANVDRKPEDSEILQQKKDKWLVPVIFDRPNDKSLNHRFFEPKSLKTAAILSIDDDLRMSCSDLKRGFEIWKKNFKNGVAPIVGYSARSHKTSRNGYLHYEFDISCGYSMILTNAAFLTPTHLQLYNANSDIMKKIRSFVTEHTNCEDIAMNMIVSKKFPNLKPVLVRGEVWIEQAKSCISCKKTHYWTRLECMNLFAKYLGGNPLKITND